MICEGGGVAQWTQILTTEQQLQIQPLMQIENKISQPWLSA
jgi:hypothetical protein